VTQPSAVSRLPSGVAGGGPSGVRHSLAADGRWLTAAGIVVVAVVAGLFFGPEAISLAIGLPLLGGAAIAILVRPERAFRVFLVLLPVYLMTLVVLYGVLRVPPIGIRLIQPWKELLLATALLGSLLQLPSRTRDFAVTWLDALVAAFVALNLAYMVFPFGDAPLLARAAGARTNLIFAGLYLLGRLARPEFVDHRGAARFLAGLAVATVVGVAVEKLLLPSDWPLKLGYSRFLSRFFGGVDLFAPNELPWTFWTEAKLFRRASAFFANPLDLAAGCLLLVGAVLPRWLRPAEGDRPRLWMWLAVGLAGAIALSLARMAAFSLPFVFLAVALALGRRKLAVTLFALTVLAGMVVVFAAGPLAVTYVRTTLVFDNASSVGHLAEWSAALRSLSEHPFGIGLGTAGGVGARLGGGGIGGENQYLIYGVQLGWPGALLFPAALAGAVMHAGRALGATGSPLFGAALAGVLALAFLGLTSEVGAYIFVSYVSWWLVGLSVTRNLTAPEVRAAARASPAAVGDVGLRQAD